MFGLETVLRVLLGILLLFSNGFFVTTEFALTRVRQFDESDFKGHAGLERAWEMTDKLELYLSSCQVGITISSVALGVVAEPAVTTVFGNLFLAVGIVETAHALVSIVVAMAIINLAHVIIGEQVPTYLGVERSQFVAKYCAPVLYLWMKVMYPVVIISDMTSKAILSLFGIEITRSWAEEEEGPATISELRNEMGLLLSGSPLSEEQQEEVLQAMEISQLPIEDIMVQSEEIVSLNTTESVDDSLSVIEHTPHSRYPLYDSDLDEYVGLVYTASVLRNIDSLRQGDMDLTDIATELPVLHPDVSVSDAIDYFQDRQQELALVSSKETETPVEKENVLGLITSTDAVEEITGELEDPYDTETA